MFAVDARQHADYFYSPSVPDRVFAQRSPSLSSSDTPPSPIDDMDLRARNYHYERRLSDPAPTLMLSSSTYNPAFSGSSLFASTCPAPAWSTKLEFADEPSPLDHHEPISRQSSQSHSSASSPAMPLYHQHQVDHSPSPSPHTPPPPTSAPPTGGKQFSFISLQGSTQRKRPRRRYDEIERLYPCSWPGCNKSYGTLNHLNAHVTMQRHGEKRLPAEFKEMRKQWRKQKKEDATIASMVATTGVAGASPRSLSGGGSRRSMRNISEDAAPALGSPVALTFAHDGEPAQPYFPHEPPRRMSLPNIAFDRFPHAGNDILTPTHHHPHHHLTPVQEYWPPQQMYALQPTLPPLALEGPAPMSAPPHTTGFPMHGGMLLVDEPPHDRAGGLSAQSMLLAPHSWDHNHQQHHQAARGTASPVGSEHSAYSARDEARARIPPQFHPVPSRIASHSAPQTLSWSRAQAGHRLLGSGDDRGPLSQS